MYRDLPLVICVLQKQSYSQSASVTTRALQSKGIRDVAAELASLNLPLAGCISHFRSNWEVITQDGVGEASNNRLQDRIPAEPKTTNLLKLPSQ